MSLLIVPATSSAPRRWVAPTLQVVTLSAAEISGGAGVVDAVFGGS
ncbi:hypothetical protein [Terriglobus sp. RCC_193]